jgi:signal transduction histidine kinase
MRGDHSGSVTSDVRNEPHALALLSHELRTPLNAVLGYADAMRVEAFGPLPEPYREQAGVIHAAASQLLAVVDAMTAIGVAETGDRPLALERLGPADLKRLLNDTVGLLAARARSSNLKLRTAVAAAVEIRADRVALAQILVNLVENAVKFTAPGGSITLGVDRAGGEVLLAVESGGGEGTPGGGPGPGLGLRLSQALSEAMGGSLTLDFSPAGGARAVVRLPAVTAS